MKSILLFLVLQNAFFNFAIAECNLNLTIASGKYIEELEKAKLTKYQNSSVCEVLDYEIGKCSNSQKTKLEKAFNVKAVHGNYCQPHLPPPQQVLNKQEFMKGAELYSWKDFQGFQWYALLPGTNRTKTTSELIAGKMSEGLLFEKFKEIPPNTEMSWNNLVSIQDKQNLEFSTPNKEVVRNLTKAAQKAGLKILL